MHKLDKLFKDYKLETKRMSAQAKADRVGIFIGMCIGIAILAIGFNYDLAWITGKRVPFLLAFLAMAVAVKFLGARLVAATVWITLVVLLFLPYFGFTLPLFVR